MKNRIFIISIYFGLLINQSISAQDVPVSDRAFNNSEEIFRFAIVADRTGGMRAGIFEDAIQKVELLQPEFVLSVGDLIDGYTEDPDVWNAQWDEFDAIIDKLSMPFYYVPGNHDTSNELLTEVWRERHGKDYYHFVYKEVLFLAINTDEIEGGGIGASQIEYFERVLEENADVRWTLIFMHRPVWSYGDRMGYERIEEALGDRNYTLFSGHHHHYRYKIHNGMEHFTLATSGGGSWLRNPEVGELDHITWVTMKEGGPEVAHIDINGIYDKNLVPEEDYDDIQVLRRGNWLEVQPVVHTSDAFSKLPVRLEVKNNSERVLTVSGELEQQQGVRFEPDFVKIQLEKGETEFIEVEALSTENESLISILNNDPLEFELTAGFERENRNDISLSTSKRLFLDWKHSLFGLEAEMFVDAIFSEWSDAEWIDVRNPQYFQEGWDWNGEEDGRFQFAVTYDDENLYVAIKFHDQLLISDPAELSSRQDKFFIHVDSNPKTEDFTQFELAISESSSAARSASNLIESVIKKNGENQFLEARIPFSALEHDSLPESVRINIGIMDHDRPENTKPSVLWWRPLWSSDQNYENSGMFWLEK